MEIRVQSRSTLGSFWAHFGFSLGPKWVHF
nr:MAG TPA: hypothetical protein [Caudoviricetes sp.]